eukprot:m.59615 g.59615  ORF g.59615 m.59615 type:complete len:430 (+) comp19116_c0_seq1:70-1359(+)
MSEHETREEKMKRFTRVRRVSGEGIWKQHKPVAEGFGAHLDDNEMDRWMEKFASACDDEFAHQMTEEANKNYQRTTTFGFLDVAPFVRNSMEAVVQDSFTQCFESRERDRWNFNFYLFPLYYIGVIIRYCILLPCRLLIVAIGLLLFALMFLVAAPLQKSARAKIHESAIKLLAKFFLWSWCAVVHIHGTLPPREPGQIFVANHSSVIDVVLLLQRGKFCLTGQAHTGLIGFFQNYVLATMNNLWFDRMTSRDRAAVAKKIREHAADVSKPPLLVFPEGTCVNNEYVVMFKRGAFDLGQSIVPVAIKYNKIFVDAFWNSRQQSFPQHLFALMTSWAVVCDVWIMEPQYKTANESATAFAARVKDMIAKQAGLISVPWDGYLKYFQPKASIIEARRKLLADQIRSRFAQKEIVFEQSESEGLHKRAPKNS